MRRTEAHQGMRMIKFRSVLDRYESSELNQIEAAELLGVTERTFRRWCHRYEEGGDAGLLDRRLGGVSGKRVPVDCAEGGGSLVSHALQRLHGPAFSRTPCPRPPVHLGLHLDEAVSAIEGLAGAGQDARGTPSQAATSAAPWDDAASGRFTP